MKSNISIYWQLTITEDFVVLLLLLMMMMMIVCPTGKVLPIQRLLSTHVEPLCPVGLQQPVEDNGRHGQGGKARITLLFAFTLHSLYLIFAKQ